MPNKFIFADEAGCFTFNRNQNVSRYFILCTVIMDDCTVAAELLKLRRKLVWDGHELGDAFHASEDRQLVRDHVYGTITEHAFTIQATIMEKSKAHPKTRETKPLFYKYGYFYHFKHGIAQSLTPTCEALVTTASLGTKKERASFESAVNDVMRQTNRAKAWKADFMPSASDPCLQVADYCAWAIMRKWERNDERSFALIRDRVTYEYDLWGRGIVHHY
jgi:hypothetical protein